MARPPLTHLERILVGLELTVAVLAVAGGAVLMAEPTGKTIGLRPDILAATPFHDFFFPGAILVLANGVLPLVVASATMLGRPWAKLGHLASGAVFFGWMVVQVLLVGWGRFLQPTFLMLGVLIAVLASAQLRGGLDLG